MTFSSAAVSQLLALSSLSLLLFLLSNAQFTPLSPFITSIFVSDETWGFHLLYQHCSISKPDMGRAKGQGGEAEQKKKSRMFLQP